MPKIIKGQKKPIWKIISAILLEYSLTHPNVWQMMTNQQVFHSKYGEGFIEKIEINNNVLINSSAIIRFKQEVESEVAGLTPTIVIRLKGFNGQIITKVSIPNELSEKITDAEREKIEQILEVKRQEDERLRQIQLAEEERLNQIRLREEQRKKEEIEKKKQAERELIARNEFRLLKSKYQIAWSEDDSPISNLNRILMKLEDKKVLSNEDEQWLKDNMYFPVLAIHYEHTSNLATAGSYWRKAGNPQRALDVTENIVSPDHYILTMRGGAYKDIKDYENATKCALAATEVAPHDYHPYNLLGAIYYQQGFPEKGDNYFQKAISLGAKPKDEEISIKSALKNAESETRKLVAQFLLSKNSTRYEWAKFYLK